MRSLVCCAVVCALFVPVPAVSATPIVLSATFDPGDEFGGAGHNIGGDNNWVVAAEFVPSVTASLASVELAAIRLNDRGSNSRSLEIDVCVDSSGEPDCAVPLDSLTLTGLTTDRQAHSAESASKPLLTAGTPYWLVVAVPNPPNDSVRWIWIEDRKGDNARRSGAGPWQVAIEEPALAFRILGESDTPIVTEGSILNIASYTLPGVPFYGIAQGSMFVVFGNTLGPDALQVSGLPRPTELANTSVQVSIGGTTVDAFLFYTSANQLAAILPSSTPTGEGTLTVTYDGQVSAPVAIHVVQSAPGIFTWNQAGFGPGIIQNWESPTEVPTNSLVEPAEPGQIEILWATGLGPISGDDSDLPPVGDLPVNVEVLVGGKSVSPIYAGRSPQFPAIDQVNFPVPPGVEGCRVPVALKVDGFISNYVTMSIASSGTTCSDPVDFSSADLEKVVQNGGAKIGAINLLSGRVKFVTPLGTLPVNVDFAVGNLYQRTLTQILSGPGVRENILLQTSPSLGTCMVSSFPRGDLKLHPDDPVPFLPLNGGPALNLTGGATGPALVPALAPGLYNAQVGGGIPPAPVFPDYLLPGQYMVDNGTGGDDVAGFNAALTLPALVTWINEDSISEISRTEDLVMTWEAGDPASEYVMIFGTSDDLSTNVTAAFTCTAPADAGSFTVPAAVLSSLHPNTPWDFQSLPTAILWIGTAPLGEVAAFEAPGLDIGYFHYGNWTGKTVDFK
jgi:uncharacterized protein (TIGR03437 family)